MGACDLILMENPHFNNGQGLHIHIRTKIKRFWSYIESAVVQIGDDRLEVKSGVEDRKHWVNGKEQPWIRRSGQLKFKIGGFRGRFRVRNDHQVQYKLFLPDDQVVMIRSVKEMLRVEITKAKAKDGWGDH